MLKEIKTHFMFNETMLPDHRDMTEAAEQFILMLNPEAKNEKNFSERAGVLAGLAWEELCQESEYITDMFGAPLPITERFEERLQSEDDEVREQAEELFELHRQAEEESEQSYPIRFFLQRHMAVAMVSLPSEAERFSAAFEFVFPDDLGLSNDYSVTEDGLIVEAVDKNGEPVDRDFLGMVYGEYVYPLQALGFRILKSIAIESEAEGDFDALKNISSVEDLFGKGM